MSQPLNTTIYKNQPWNTHPITVTQKLQEFTGKSWFENNNFYYELCHWKKRKIT